MGGLGQWFLIAASVLAIIIIILVARRLINRQPSKIPEISDNDGFVDWLCDYEHWYNKSARRYHLTVYVARPAPIVLGFMVAIVSAMRDQWSFFDDFIPKNIIVITLTGLASLCVAILTQLGVIDLARYREIGRINCARLVARARLFFSIPHSPEEIYKEKDEIIKELFKIEHDQAALFASVTRNATRASNPNGQS